MQENKEFNRKICFTFFEDYRKTAKEIEGDYGKEGIADYYNAIIDYALYEIEPELKGVIKYIWHTTKTTIDKSIDRRARGFSREDTEMTEKIQKYKRENPSATQREIAEATGSSIGKVNKTLKNTSDTNADSSAFSNTTSITNACIEHEHEQTFKTEEMNKDSHRQRKLEELSLEEKTELVNDFKSGKKYAEMYKKYNLVYGCLTKETLLQLEEELRINAYQKEKEAKKELNQNALIKFELTRAEGNELCDYLCGHPWEAFGDTIVNFINEYTSPTNKSAKELLVFLRENELARNNVYERNNYRTGDNRFIIDQEYRWDYYRNYLVDYINNPHDVAKKVQEYEMNKRN